jgi:hypothetical protein
MNVLLDHKKNAILQRAFNFNKAQAVARNLRFKRPYTRINNVVTWNPVQQSPESEPSHYVTTHMHTQKENNTFWISCASLSLISPSLCFWNVSCPCQTDLSLHVLYQGYQHEQILSLFLIGIVLFPAHCLHALNVWCSHQGLLF